jgi:hypothetical protein
MYLVDSALHDTIVVVYLSLQAFHLQLPQRASAYNLVVRGPRALRQLCVNVVTMSSLAYLPQNALDALVSAPYIQVRYQDIDTSPDEVGVLLPCQLMTHSNVDCTGTPAVMPTPQCLLLCCPYNMLFSGPPDATSSVICFL